MLGASASGTIFLSLKKFEGTFSNFPVEFPGTAIRHDVCTDFTKPGKEMTLLLQLDNCLFVPLDRIISKHMINA